MAFYRANMSSGGGTLNPSVVYHAANSASGSYTIDATKKYIAIGSGKVQYAGSLTRIAYINNGALTMLQNCSYVRITLSETTLSLRYTGTGSGEFEVIQLD